MKVNIWVLIRLFDIDGAGGQQSISIAYKVNLNAFSSHNKDFSPHSR